MSTSYEKVVKLACKPKAAPPKPKYMDPIIAATWSEDGAVHDVCKALSPRFREPNVIIVFKALIVLHTMIRNGATDNVLGYLSSSDILRLKNISAGAHWEGYNAPQNLQSYAVYLDTRIRAYRDLKHDAIRVQSETNRDMRNSAAIEEDRQDHTEKKRFGRRKGRESDESPQQSSSVQRSKTIAGRKLRVMTVEKGLLRETKIVQKMIDSLVECRLYLDDLEDELNTTALRMLVKDLLILFQACNEGVINVLEHYFEMSKLDAKEALAIYRHFCNETEKVVEFLGVARKLQNLLNVPIPNLRHAPVSLAGALEEYLKDPNFEQNRIEYKTNKEIADRNARNGIKTVAKPVQKAPEAKAVPAASPAASSSSPPPEVKTPNNQAMIDFFTAIEEEQPTMFNPQTNSPTTGYFQQQAAQNPFAHQQMMMNSQPFAIPQIQQPMQMQQTGFLMPQHTAMPTNPFGQQIQQQGFGGMLQPQATGMLVPQATGSNPFRQSMLLPQSTGMPGPMFGMQQPQQQMPMQTGVTNPFPQNNAFGGQQSSNPFPSAGPGQAQPTGSNPFPGPGQQSTNPFPNFNGAFGGANQSQLQPPNSAPLSSNPFPPPSPFATNGNQPSFASPLAQPAGSTPSNVPPRSASVPLSPPGSDPPLVKTHQTGSRNPFGQPVAPAPPVPKIPTLMELAMGQANRTNTSAFQQPQPTGMDGALKPTMTGFNPSQNSSVMSSIASSFSANNFSSTNPSSGMNASSTSASPPSTSPMPTGSTFSASLFSSMASQPTSATSASSSSNPASGISALQPQTTGFTGLKAFKPTSSFGAALLDSLPPIPQSAPTTPGSEQPKHTPSGSLGSAALLNSQPTAFNSGLGVGGASTVGVGLRPQATGAAGGANPFRATMFSLSPGPTGNAFGGGLSSTTTGLGASSSFGGTSSTPGGGAFGGFAGGLASNPTGMPSTGASLFGASSFASGAQNPGQAQQQQNGQASLI